MTKRHKYVIKSEMGGAGGSLKFPADVLAEWNISADRVLLVYGITTETYFGSALQQHFLKVDDVTLPQLESTSCTFRGQCASEGV